VRGSVCARLTGMFAINVTRVMVSSKSLEAGAMRKRPELPSRSVAPLSVLGTIFAIWRRSEPTPSRSFRL
jgi:hypothetical protein